MQLKPHPTYRCLQVDELPDATLDAILGSKRKSPVTGALDQMFMKWVWATGGTELDGTKSWQGKVGNSREKVPRKRYVMCHGGNLCQQPDKNLQVYYGGAAHTGKATHESFQLPGALRIASRIVPAQNINMLSHTPIEHSPSGPNTKIWLD